MPQVVLFLNVTKPSNSGHMWLHSWVQCLRFCHFFFNEMIYIYIYKWYVSGGFGASFFSNLNETVKHCTNFPLKFTVCAVVLEQS